MGSVSEDAVTRAENTDRAMPWSAFSIENRRKQESLIGSGLEVAESIRLDIVKMFS